MRCMKYKNLVSSIFCVLLVVTARAQAVAPALSVLVKADAGAIIWLDNLRYGEVAASGELIIKNLKPGVHALRARLTGQREFTKNVQLASGKENVVQIVFAALASASELSFQTAENLREKGKHKDAILEYQNAIRLSKTPLPRARVGLARSLAATGEYSDAVDEAKRAAREAATHSALAAEAITVAANTFRSQGLYDEAFENYAKALRLVRNISPEAHTGLALTYQEENKVNDAINHLQFAAAQSNDTEPIIYYLLGNLLDREGQIKLAVEAYEKFLALDPSSKFAATTRSMLKQLKREAKNN